MDTVTRGFNEFVAFDDVVDAFGISGRKLEVKMQNAQPPMYDSWLYGKRYINMKDYKRLEADFLKGKHKQAAYRQAIGIIGRWDCLTANFDYSDKIIASKWSRFLNQNITPADVSDMIYIFVTMREEKETRYTRPNDHDFMQLAFRWGVKTGINLTGEDAEQLLSIFVEGRDFFEPLPYAENQ